MSKITQGLGLKEKWAERRREENHYIQLCSMYLLNQTHPAEISLAHSSFFPPKKTGEGPKTLHSSNASKTTTESVLGREKKTF